MSADLPKRRARAPALPTSPHPPLPVRACGANFLWRRRRRGAAHCHECAADAHPRARVLAPPAQPPCMKRCTPLISSAATRRSRSPSGMRLSKRCVHVPTFPPPRRDPLGAALPSPLPLADATRIRACASPAQYNGVWHCMVGSNFGAYMTHEKGHNVYFYVGQQAVLLFKTG